MEPSTKRICIRFVEASPPFLPLHKLSELIQTPEDVDRVCKEYEFDINDKYYYKYTLLATSILKKHLRLSLILIKCAHVDVNKCEPFLLSMNQRDCLVFDALLARPDVDIQKYASANLLHAVACRNFYALQKIVPLIKSQRAKTAAVERVCRLYKRAVRRKCRKTETFDKMIKLLVLYGAEIRDDFMTETRTHDLFGHWRSLLPPWSPATHIYYPVEFKQRIFTWLCINNRLKLVCKDINQIVLKILAQEFVDF